LTHGASSGIHRSGNVRRWKPLKDNYEDRHESYHRVQQIQLPFQIPSIVTLTHFVFEIYKFCTFFQQLFRLYFLTEFAWRAVSFTSLLASRTYTVHGSTSDELWIREYFEVLVTNIGTMPELRVGTKENHGKSQEGYCLGRD
jgi:hypothetical protein